MGERLTDEEFAEFQRLLDGDGRIDIFEPGASPELLRFNVLLDSLLTEVRERRAEDEERELSVADRERRADKSVAGAWAKLRAEKVVFKARIATLEASLRECLPSVEYNAIAVEHGVVQRARAALKGGGA